MNPLLPIIQNPKKIQQKEIKLYTKLTDEHRCKSSQQNTARLDCINKIIHSDQVSVVHIYMIQFITTVTTTEITIVSIDVGKAFYKIQCGL